MSKCPSCREPLDYPSGDGCAAMQLHKERVMTVGETNQSRSAADLIKRDDVLAQVTYTSSSDDMCYAPFLIDRIAALPAVTVGVKPLVWTEVCERRSEEDPREEHTGGYEADCDFGSYVIDIGWGSDSYYWSVMSPDQFDIGSDFEDPEYAKAAAQADYEARILAALTPVADSPPADPVVNAPEYLCTFPQCGCVAKGQWCPVPCTAVRKAALLDAGYDTTAIDPAAIREAARLEAAEKATARWAARRKHADQLAEMDYPEAAIDAKTVSAKADEAEMIAEEILALIGEKK